MRKVALDLGHDHGPGESCAVCTALGHSLNDTLHTMRHPGASSGHNALDIMNRSVPSSRANSSLVSERNLGDNFSGPINISLHTLRALDENRKGLIAPDTLGQTTHELAISQPTTWEHDQDGVPGLDIDEPFDYGHDDD